MERTGHHPGLRVVLMGWSDPMERSSLLEHATADLPKASEAEDFVAAALAAAAAP